MSSLVSQCFQFVPSLRRFARAVLLNKVHADQMVKECLLEAKSHIKNKNAEAIRKHLFQSLLRRMKAKKFDLNANKDLAQEALRNLLGKNNRSESKAQAIVVALSQLSQGEREILLLAALEGFRYKDIGKMTGNSLSTVMARLHNGRELMREILFGSVAIL